MHTAIPRPLPSEGRAARNLAARFFIHTKQQELSRQHDTIIVMANELLLIISALADIVLVFIVARAQPQRLFGTIVLNLILITIFGGKLISLFGYSTNVGNVFYACVFLATHFLLERRDKKDVYPVIWFGIVSVLFFTLVSQLAVSFSSAVPGDPLSEAMRTVFSLSPRIAFASLIAYAFAQFVNIYLYDWIKAKTKGRLLCLRSNGANVVAQFVDSCLFFTIAFIDLPGSILIQAILVGWAVKTFVVLLGSPLLYLDRYLSKKSR